MLRALLILLSALTLFAQKPELSDADIEVQLHTRLAKSVIGNDHFTVRVKGGIVYWEGSTTVGQHKGAATRMAKSSGARRVVNNIRVSSSKKAATPASAAAPASKKDAPKGSAPPAAASPAPALKRASVQWMPVQPR
ncbi:MAG: BON domain-containing protein [Acidobacteriota bacterium]